VLSTPLARQFAVALALAAVGSVAGAQVTFSASGATAADIFTSVNAFRTALGTLNPNVAGSFGVGRREINWDGVPDALSSPNALPNAFFNSNSPRGAVFSTPGTGFQVSGKAGVAPVRFDNINATYSSIFQTFSAQRLFSPIGSTITDMHFFVPGSTAAATTSAFGAIFADVDDAANARIELFDVHDQSLGVYNAPAFDRGLSFFGVQLAAGQRISRVRITSGNTALGPNDGGAVDVVAMDDFLYAEPSVVTPEPATLALLGTGVGALVLARRRRRTA
jgi:hypothetical protein